MVVVDPITVLGTFSFVFACLAVRLTPCAFLPASFASSFSSSSSSAAVVKKQRQSSSSLSKSKDADHKREVDRLTAQLEDARKQRDDVKMLLDKANKRRATLEDEVSSLRKDSGATNEGKAGTADANGGAGGEGGKRGGRSDTAVTAADDGGDGESGGGGGTGDATEIGGGDDGADGESGLSKRLAECQAQLMQALQDKRKALHLVVELVGRKRLMRHLGGRDGQGKGDEGAAAGGGGGGGGGDSPGVRGGDDMDGELLSSPDHAESKSASGSGTRGGRGGAHGGRGGGGSGGVRFDGRAKSASPSRRRRQRHDEYDDHDDDEYDDEYAEEGEYDDEYDDDAGGNSGANPASLVPAGATHQGRDRMQSYFGALPLESQRGRDRVGLDDDGSRSSKKKKKKKKKKKGKSKQAADKEMVLKHYKALLKLERAQATPRTVSDQLKF